MNMLEQSNMLLQEAAAAIARIEDVIIRIKYLKEHNQPVETDLIAGLITAKALVLKAAGVVAATAFIQGTQALGLQEPVSDKKE